MEAWVTSVMEQYGYVGIFLVIMLENLFPPIPSELVLPFGGFMTTYTGLTPPAVVAVATAGSVAGAVVLYGVGRLIDVGTLERIVYRWGHLLRVSVNDIHKASSWFDRYGYWAVFFCRMVPLVRSLISIPAGMAHMHFGLFLLLTTAGTLLWNSLLVGVGVVLGESWEDILEFMHVYSLATYIVLGLAATTLIALWVARRIRTQSKR